ncbi:hypothetical protein F5Y14DRAFT_456410 [Nemania sp. NC0429]|nr:hypothetical protein F5Y14DRAFT_456410 [Nemania sp. NC0429]
MSDEPDTIPAPTVLFWMVCFALNAMTEPYGSVLAYLKYGRSRRMATVETFLNRLQGGRGLMGVVDLLNARSVIQDMALAAAKVMDVIPSESESDGTTATTVQSSEAEMTRDAVKHLISRTLGAEAHLNLFVRANQPLDGQQALAALKALLIETTETEILLGQLIIFCGRRQSVIPRGRAYPGYARGFTTQLGFRWFCFGLGVLHQVIKLFGSSGVPLFEAYGAMYLFSWLYFEALVVAAKTLKLDESETARVAKEDDESAAKRDDRITQSGNAKIAARLPEGTVAMSGIAATSSPQPGGGSLARKEDKLPKLPQQS